MLKNKSILFAFVSISIVAFVGIATYATTYYCSTCDGYVDWVANEGGGEIPGCPDKIEDATLGSCVSNSPNPTTCEEYEYATHAVTTYTVEIDEEDKNYCIDNFKDELSVDCLSIGMTGGTIPSPCNVDSTLAFIECLNTYRYCEVDTGPTYSVYDWGCI